MEKPGPQTRNRNEKRWFGGCLVHSQGRLGYAAVTSILKIPAAYQNVILFPAQVSFPGGSHVVSQHSRLLLSPVVFLSFLWQEKRALGLKPAS